MKQKIMAGGELDLITPAEMRSIATDVLKSWRTELARGPKFRDYVMGGRTSAGGALGVGTVTDGPAEGMTWAITRLSVAPGPTLAASGIQVYVNDDAASPSALRIRNLQTDLFPGDHGLVINSGSYLRLVGAGITADTDVVVTMAIKEVPTLEAWSL